MGRRAPPVRELPPWARGDADQAAQYIIHRTDPLYQAEQRRVSQYRAARRKVIAHVRTLEPLTRWLTDIDRNNLHRASVQLLDLMAQWERSNQAPTAATSRRGHPKSTEDRDDKFAAIIDTLVREGWDAARRGDRLHATS